MAYNQEVPLSAIDLPPDERKLLEIVREIKREGAGHGDLNAQVQERRIVMVRKVQNFKI